MEINGNMTLAEVQQNCQQYTGFDACRKCDFCFLKDGYTTCIFKDCTPCHWPLRIVSDNQSAKVDANKPRPTLIDMGILEAVRRTRRTVIEKAGADEKQWSEEIKRDTKSSIQHFMIIEAQGIGEEPHEIFNHPILWHIARGIELLINDMEHPGERWNTLQDGSTPFPSLTRALTAVREYGVKKYTDPENWRRVEPQRYRDALWRHWLEYLDDENSKDDESGLPHLWHVACNIMFLIALEG